MIPISANIAVITGGPGSGKTTLCDYLSSQEIEIGHESGRAVLAKAGGHELGKRDPLAYSHEILQRDIENFKTAKLSSRNWLFDRGFPDNAGFLDLMGLKRSNGLYEACRNLRYS